MIYNKTMKKIRFTKEGYQKCKQDYEDLLKSRPDAVAHLKKSRELGDLSENGYYKASRAKLSSIDHQLLRLKISLKQAMIVENPLEKGASIGCTVILIDDKNEYTYNIVGDLEANPAEGKISLLSPLGKAIEGKKQGDKIEFMSPRGLKIYTIKKFDK